MKKSLLYLLFFSGSALLGQDSEQIRPSGAIDRSEAMQEYPLATEKRYGSGGTEIGDPDFTKARAAADHWLTLVDQYQFDAAWLEGSILMKDVLPRNIWVVAMRQLRPPLGLLKARKVTYHASSQVLPFGTRGAFMTITYDSRYTAKAAVTETVILMQEGPMHLWKVVSFNLGTR